MSPGSGPAGVRIRGVVPEDLPVFFAQQLDPEANRMAAFAAKDPTDRDAFLVHWGKLLEDAGIDKRTVLFEDRIAGHLLSFDRLGRREVSYWLGKEFWGRGIATRALSLFLGELTVRPLHARVAKDNPASFRVLEKCGFRVVGEDRGFANARGEEIEEYILELGGPEVDSPGGR